MNEALKTLENLAKFMERELARIQASNLIKDTAYDDIKKAHLQALELGKTIQTARAWQISK